jgi:two-component system, cell cycle response regulator DivK
VTDARAEGEAITGKRILCVEDSDDSLFMLHRRLTRAGFDVKVSSNGAESVEWARTLLPDLIVMDLNLPGLDGWEATRRLKAQSETKHIPIIVLTANTSKKSRDDALAAGCDEFELKPIDFPALLVKIQSLIARSAQAE